MAKKVKTDIDLVEEVLKKFKSIYPNKFILYCDSIAINELQNPKNNGECNGTRTTHIKSPYKEAFRKLFYNNMIETTKVLHINSMSGIRELIDSHRETPETFYEDLYKNELVTPYYGDAFTDETRRIEKELERYKDKSEFIHFEFLNNEDVVSEFLDAKNSMLLKSNNEEIPDVIINAGIIPFITSKTISDVEYIMNVEDDDVDPAVYFVTFHMETDMLDTYSTYHFINM